MLKTDLTRVVAERDESEALLAKRVEELKEAETSAIQLRDAVVLERQKREALEQNCVMVCQGKIYEL